MKKNKKIINMALCVTALVSAVLIGKGAWENLFSGSPAIEAEVPVEAPAEAETEAEAEVPVEAPADAENEAEAAPVHEPSARLAEAMSVNSDVVGWLSFAWTVVDYPIVHGTQYLDYDIYGNEDLSSICLDEFQELDGEGVHAVYGHRMADGSMLKSVVWYLDDGYMAEHQDITVETADRDIKLKAVYCYEGQSDPSYRYQYPGACVSGFIKEKTGLDIETDSVYVFITCRWPSALGRIYLFAVEADAPGAEADTADIN